MSKMIDEKTLLIDEETLCGINAVLSEIDHSLQLVDDDFNKLSKEDLVELLQISKNILTEILM